MGRARQHFDLFDSILIKTVTIQRIVYACRM